MAGIGFGIGIGFGGNGHFDTDAKNYFNTVSTPFTEARKEIINDLVVSLKSYNIWSNLDRLWLFATEAQDQARVSLINPSSTNITEVNSPTWTLDQGYDYNGTTQYLNSNYAPSAGVKYTQNSASAFVYTRENIQEAKADFGALNAAATQQVALYSRYDAGGAFFRINDSGVGGSTVLNSDSRGLFSIVRTGANAEALHKNGTSILSQTLSSTTPTTNNIFISARNIDGTASLFSSRQQAIMGIGSGSINQANLYTVIQAYMTSLGTQV